MKKLLIFAALIAATTTGCDIDAELNGSKSVIDGIFVNPGEWKVATTANGAFDYYYCDKPIHDITEAVFNRKVFDTYWKTEELREGERVHVQTPLPAVIDLERFQDGLWIPYTETISCSYEIGYLRIMISRSDFYDVKPTNTLEFRTVISY